jgi:sugar-specific transcriptional regulator TrmB
VGVDALNRLVRAAEKIGRLEPELKAAREELYAALVEAHRRGVDISILVRLSNLSRARVYQILGRAPEG